MALETKSLQHLNKIPADVHVVYSTVSGDFKAKEIFTIPFADTSGVYSVISLASIKSYFTVFEAVIGQFLSMK